MVDYIGFRVWGLEFKLLKGGLDRRLSRVVCIGLMKGDTRRLDYGSHDNYILRAFGL